MEQVSQKAYEQGKEWGWGEFECTHGYGIFNGDYPTSYGYIKAEHIEVIGDMDDGKDFWKSDVEAAAHAEAHCGYKIIRDIKGIDPVFIDTPNNRSEIMKQISENFVLVKKEVK